MDASPLASLVGRPVFDIEVRPLGKVVEVRGDALTVEGGRLRRRRYRLEAKDIQAAVPDGVFLSLPKISCPKA